MTRRGKPQGQGRSQQPARSKGRPQAKQAGRRGGVGGTPGPPPTRRSTPRPRPQPGDKRRQVRRSPAHQARGGSAGAKRTVGGEQVEGRHAVLELLMTGARKTQEVWISSEVDDAPVVDDIREVAEANGVMVRDVARPKFLAQARCEAPQGVLALAAPLPEMTVEDLLRGRQLPSLTGRRSKSPQRKAAVPFLVALDGVTDPGNLGAVLRSAECAGASGVVLPRHRAVNVTPAATKAAAGAVEHLPIALVGGLPTTLAQLRKQEVLVVGLDGDAEQSLDDLPPVDGPVCLVLGSEGRGLSRLVRQRCDVVVGIPMFGRLGSLNVSAAAAVACFEVARARAGG